MKVADVMTRDVATVSRSTPVADIVKLLIAKRISAVPVVGEGGELVGMVSEADLLHRPEAGTEARRPWWLDLFSDPDSRAEAFLKAHGRNADQVMTREVEVVSEDTPLASVAKLMDERRVKRLPVVRDGRVVGIVARSDLIRTLAQPRTAPPPTRDDLAIKDRFLRNIRSAGLASADTVTILVEDSNVQLWGVAESVTERRALELAAAEIPGVRSVENRLALRETVTTGV